jgi:polyhydroxybutyrate depolymerase
MKVRICFVLCILCSAATLFAREPILMKWRVETVQREALVFLPSTPAETKAPVIFAFHGHGGNMRFAARGMHFHDQWPEAIVVYMQGLPTPGLIVDRKGVRPGWQRDAGEQNDRDLKFFDQVLASLREKYAMDERRIYASGFSNGGLFTYLLWAERPNVFAGFAPGGAVILPSVHLTRARACLHYGGKNDRLARFAKQEQTIDEVRKLNKCGEGKSCGEYCTLYPSELQTPVMTYIHPAGHLYPPPVTALIVKFFQEHPRGS